MATGVGPVAVALCVALLAAPAGALVVNTQNPVRHENPPVDDPGWLHVGRRGGTSAVYLGGGWVLTAAHVGAGELRLDGVAYPAVAGSEAPLVDPGDGGVPADLVLYRLDPAPPLPALPLLGEPPAQGALAILIGHGRGRGAQVEWRGTSGYRWGERLHRRWGTNQVVLPRIDVSRSGRTTRCFQTSFDRRGTPHEAQAAQGDSGGAVFVRGDSGWALAGILISVGAFPGQDPQTSLFGNTTNVADLSHYREQIERILGR